MLLIGEKGVSAMIADADDAWDGGRLEETKRVARLIRLATLLTTQPRRWKRAELAVRFEIGQRQVARDLDLLRGLGYTLRATHQGYAFDNAPVLPALSLTVPEVLALALAASLARDSGDVDPATLGAALARLDTLMPVAARPLIRQAALAWDRAGAAHARRREALHTMLRSLASGRQVQITYATASRGGEVTDRMIDPYAVYPYDRSWMVTGFDSHRQAVRDFKIDRVLSARLLDSTYTIPGTFDLTRYRGSAWGVLRGEATTPEEIVLLFDTESGRWVREEQRDERMRFEERTDGTIVVRFTAGITPELVRWVLWYGPHCRVEQPTGLRAQVRELAEQTATVQR